MSKPALIRRRDAVEKVLARFDGKSFLLGRRDCAILAASLLRGLGHKVPKVRPYKNEVGAVRALRELGAKDLAALLDSLGLPRIAPATALMGDLMFTEGDGEAGIGALHIALGNGAVMGFHEDHPGLISGRAVDVKAAWSVLP